MNRSIVSSTNLHVFIYEQCYYYILTLTNQQVDWSEDQNHQLDRSLTKSLIARPITRNILENIESLDHFLII